ncbi:MFS general substrate transporter [Rickenella mellea]|uniref:MFS general substrate transporter n=1 Tax=Rickenella mellea TaxID=50990 RepID=A0A4Y7QH10_9AGAM|nr:MFS general substrate transporter [Rickenella mellea]
MTRIAHESDNLKETPVTADDSVDDEDMYDSVSIDPSYRAKAKLVNKAIQDLGMGKYQWWLFVVSGFGWFSDSVWPLATGLILPAVINEFKFRGPFLSLAANIGLLVGAAFWGLGCDLWGRRWSFNLTILIAGVFALAAGGSTNFISLSSLVAVLGIGVGGNLPVDSAVFLEFVPASHQYLLTVLSIWWAIGQLLGSLIAWPLMVNFSCPQPSTSCKSSENRGWRYLMFALGGLMLFLWAVRFFVFRMYESPKYLIVHGKDSEAVAVLRKVAHYNGRSCSLTSDELALAGIVHGDSDGSHNKPGQSAVRTARTWWAHVTALFCSRKMAWSTIILIVIWGLIGLASTLYNNFLPFLLASRGTQFGDGSVNITYRNQVILSLTGVPGALLAGWAVDLPVLGRRKTLAIACVITAIFLFATTTARTSNALLGWNCGYSFFSNIMYGVLYAASPEMFPAKDRGTGNGLVSISTRIFGVLAPVIALYANLETVVPVYISGGLIIAAGLLALALPFEPRGTASL